MPVLKENVEAQLKGIGLYDDWHKREEIECLPDIMIDSEKILTISSGLSSGNTWVIVATNERVILLNKSPLYKLKHFELPYSKITGIMHKTGILMGDLTICTEEDETVVTMIPKDSLKQLVEVITNHIDSKPETYIKANCAACFEEDFITKLERLAALKEKDMLTDEEFSAAKTKVLGN